jgi:SulP family sulfate permease
VIVGIVALPLAIAFAIASGVTPGRGLWTAIVAGFLISALGGSRVQIGGPTGAFVVIVYGIVQKFGIDGLIVATFMAGIILIVMGITRFGGMVKFIPHPVITGFTSGIALIIISGEVKDFFGIGMGAVPADFVDRISAYASHAQGFSADAVGIAVLALLIIVIWPRVNRTIPGTLVALLITTAIAHWAKLPIETIGTRFGEISASFPHPQVPHLSFAQVRLLVGPAFTIAMLAAVESLLSAVVADGMIGGRHRSNMELVAQGVANVVTPMFGGIPATGAIARTATNIKHGGRTPVAGIIHSLTLLVITLFVGRWVALIPMATLAAILVVVSYHMSEWRVFVAEMHSPKSDVAVLLATFGLTVFVDLTVAISVGMVMAAFLFVRRMSAVTSIGPAAIDLQEVEDDSDEDDYYSDPASTRDRRIPRGVEVYEIKGPFFFGAAEAFKDTISQIAGNPKVLILRMRAVSVLDSTGLHALKDVVHRSRKDGTTVLLSEVRAQPLAALTNSSVMEDIGLENLFDDFDAALESAGVRSGNGLPLTRA